MSLLNLSALRAADTIELAIRHPVTGDETGWIWTIAGPGHPQTLAHNERVQRKRLTDDRLKEQARVNGKRWKADDKDPDEIRQENIAGIAARVVNFTPVSLDGTSETAYSPEAVNKLLSDPAYGWLLGQVIECLTDDAAFFPSSAKG